MTEDDVGRVLVPVMTGLGFIAAFVLAFVRWRQGRADVLVPHVLDPKGAFRVKFMSGAIQSMPHFPTAFLAYEMIVREMYASKPEVLKKLLDIEFAIYPPGAVLPHSTWQSTHDEDLQLCVGTVDRQSFWFGILRPFRVHVMQFRQGSTREERLGIGSGTPIEPLSQTAFFHELAQHWMPFVVEGHWNADHGEAGWDTVERRLEERYDSLARAR